MVKLLSKDYSGDCEPFAGSDLRNFVPRSLEKWGLQSGVSLHGRLGDNGGTTNGSKSRVVGGGWGNRLQAIKMSYSIRRNLLEGGIDK